jgi:hypothetical protein
MQTLDISVNIRFKFTHVELLPLAQSRLVVRFADVLFRTYLFVQMLVGFHLIEVGYLAEGSHRALLTQHIFFVFGTIDQDLNRCTCFCNPCEKQVLKSRPETDVHVRIVRRIVDIRIEDPCFSGIVIVAAH